MRWAITNNIKAISLLNEDHSWFEIFQSINHLSLFYSHNNNRWWGGRILFHSWSRIILANPRLNGIRPCTLLDLCLRWCVGGTRKWVENKQLANNEQCEDIITGFTLSLPRFLFKLPSKVLYHYRIWWWSRDDLCVHQESVDLIAE